MKLKKFVMCCVGSCDMRFSVNHESLSGYFGKCVTVFVFCCRISETAGSYENEGGRHHGGDSTVDIQSAFFKTLCFVGGVGVIRDYGDGNENGKKAIGLDWQNNKFARASRFFVHFFGVVARLQRENA